MNTNKNAVKTTLYCPDIECDSCVKIISRVLDRKGGVKGYVINQDRITITHDSTIKPKTLIAAIVDKGYRISANPIGRPTVGERTREFLKDKKKYAIEYTMLKYLTITLLIALALEAAFVLMIDLVRPGFLASHGIWIFYLTISVIPIAAAIWHFKAYRTTVTCMTGMMVGMTVGMQTGMLVGAVIGVTNGFFFGAMTGMILGSIVGAYTGNCCGVMGIMEGLMAGIMGGTMGAMITVMMFNDHLMVFMPVYVILNLLILVGFSYMLFEELVEGKEPVRKPAGFFPFAIASLLALALLTALIVVAPTSIFLG